MTPQDINVPYSAPLTKECSRCKEPRPLYDFKKRAKNADGLNGICRSCENKEKRDKNYPRVPDIDTKVCTRCNTEKTSSKFPTDRSNTTGVSSWCKDCYRLYGNLHEKTLETPEDRRARKIRKGGSEWTRTALIRCKTRANQKGIPFNIDSTDLLGSDGSLPKFCCIFPHIEMDYKAGSDRRLWASVDRIVPELGYTKGNVCVISFAANIWKNNGSNEAERKRIIEIMTGNKIKVRGNNTNAKEQRLLFAV